VNVRVATVLFAMALAAIPIGVASKFMLGLTGATWIDPSLVLALAALLALLPRWGDFLNGGLRLAVMGAAALFFLSLVCALSGATFRPPASLYTPLREPLRLWLNLCWFLLSCWFLVYKPRVVLRWSIFAVVFGLAAGIYLQLVAVGLAPAPASVVAYSRSYFFRQAIWFNGIPIPRMGGLFFESPPFGLFMFSMLVVLLFTRETGRYPRWTAWGISLAGLGMLFSLADQVLVAGTVGLLASLPQLAKNRPGVVRPLVVVATIAICAFLFHSLSVKNISSTADMVTEINGGSVGERSFHFRYGVSLLQAHPTSTFFGLGPGRYGEFASETGAYPDSVNIQTSELEILVEWGVIGLAAWIALLACVAGRAWELHGVVGVGLLLGLIIADSFQANWKHEAAFLAIAALCTRRLVVGATESRLLKESTARLAAN
jgi:uncharacterized protein with PQ loop repeat